MKSIHRLASRRTVTGLGFPVSRALPLQSLAANNRLWQRSYSAAGSQLAGLDASKLSISKTSTPKEITSPKDLVFGKTFTGMEILIPGGEERWNKDGIADVLGE